MGTLQMASDHSFNNPPFAPRLPEIIGRDLELKAIREAIKDSANSHILYFCGPGGLGKTRLLEEVDILAQEKEMPPFFSTPLIDLYDAKYHSPGGLRAAIIEGLEAESYFLGYSEKRKEYLEKRDAGVRSDALEIIRREQDEIFHEEYALFAQDRRLVLRFDTMELAQYESDIVQDVCGVEDVDTVTKNWLEKNVSLLPNTVTLFAGRPNEQMQADFEEHFGQSDCHYKKYDLGFLSAEQTEQYLQKLIELLPNESELQQYLTQKANRDRLYSLTIGRPIYLTLIIEILLHGSEEVRDILPPHLDAEHAGRMIEKDQDVVGKHLIEYLYTKFPSPFGEMVYILLHARKGLDENLLRPLMGDSWLEEEIKENLAQMAHFVFVKTRPDTKQLFLHDEVYELFDRYFHDAPGYGEIFKTVADYYRQQLDATSREEREAILVTLLYYEFQLDVYTGYQQCYARWDEEAIIDRNVGLDMRLRNEGLLFMNRYANEKSPYYAPRVGGRVNRAAIDRDCAVRWVKRFMARGEFDDGIKAAEKLRASTNSTFDWESIDDLLYKAGLLTAWSELLLYKSADEKDIRPKLEEAITLLTVDRNWNEDERWWRARILGRAYNNLGYMHRRAFRLFQAVRYYNTAIHHYRQADLKAEMADSLNNAAYAYSLVGDISRADKLIDDALELRRGLGKRLPLALSLNTCARVHRQADEPHRARALSEEALQIFRDVEDLRGIGMSAQALGQIYRDLGKLERRGVYKPEDAVEHFRKAQMYLEEALRIYGSEKSKVHDPQEAVITTLELAALERDRGILAQKIGKEDQALSHYDKAMEQLEQCLAMNGGRWPLLAADCLEDKADIYIKRNQLTQAEATIRQAEAVIPSEYHLTLGYGFTKIVEPIAGFWSMLGKLRLQRAKLTLRPVPDLTTLTEEEEDILLEAMEQYALAIAYFWQFSKARRLHEETISEIYRLLKVYKLERLQKVRERVTKVAAEYHVDVSILLKEIDETLALKDPPELF